MINLREAIDAVQQYLRSGKTLDDFNNEHGIRGKTDGDHIILDYDMLNVRWDEPYGYVCRGLILCAHTFEVLGFGLSKFFNSGEGYAAEINWDTARIYEKLDGTMVNRWWSPHREKFCYSTRYQLPDDLVANQIGDMGMTWEQLLDRCIGELADTLNQEHYETTVFEVMSPVNRVVVQHIGYNCGLLCRRNNRTLEEHDLSHHPLAPKTFAFTNHDEVEEFAHTLKGTESEGFVVVDGNFHRIKIKGGEYVRLHHLKDSAAGSMKALILVVRNGEVDEVSNYFPEFIPAMQQVQQIINDLIARHEAAYDDLFDLESQKEFALGVQARELENPGLLFTARAGKAESIQDAVDKLDDPKYIRMVKPLVEKAGVTLISTEENEQ